MPILRVGVRQVRRHVAEGLERKKRTGMLKQLEGMYESVMTEQKKQQLSAGFSQAGTTRPGDVLILVRRAPRLPLSQPTRRDAHQPLGSELIVRTRRDRADRELPIELGERRRAQARREQLDVLRLAEDLQRKGYVARTIGIKLRYTDFRRISRDLTLPEPTADPMIIRRAAGECLRRVALEHKFRLLGVKASGLIRQEQLTQAGHQWDLFEEQGDSKA